MRSCRVPINISNATTAHWQLATGQSSANRRPENAILFEFWVGHRGERGLERWAAVSPRHKTHERIP